MALPVVAFAVPGGLTSGSGSTPGTAWDYGYASAQTTWDELRVIRDVSNTPFTIVPSGATGNQINQVLHDFGTGTAALWKKITGCNSSGEIVEGCYPTIIGSGFGATAISMYVFKPSQEFVELSNVILDGGSTSSSTGSYNLANNSGEVGTAAGTNTTSATYKFRLRNVIGRRARHNDFSWWGGQAGAFPRWGLEVINCRIGDGSGSSGSNGIVIARPGTNGNCLSILVEDSILEGNLSGNGLQINSGTNACDVTIRNSVIARNFAGGANLTTAGVVRILNTVFNGNGTSGGYNIQFNSECDSLVDGCVIANSVGVGVSDLAWDGGAPAGRKYGSNLVYANASGEMEVVDDGGGGTLLNVPGDVERYAPVFKDSSSLRADGLVMVNRGVNRVFGYNSAGRNPALRPNVRVTVPGWR